jgi:hypothetical protein
MIHAFRMKYHDGRPLFDAVTKFACMSAVFLIAVLALAGCAAPAAVNGTGYRYVRFTTADAIRAVTKDPTAAASIAANNSQCQKDAGCRK